jgi:GAF domain-containing protein
MSPDELLRQLGELASSLGPAVRPAGADELLRSLTETARRLFGAAACSLALLTEDESELVYTVAAGQGADDVTGMRIPASRGIAGWVVQSGQPIAISDVAADPRFSREQAEQTGYIPQAILAVPVQTPARLLGVISLLDRDPRRPGAEQDMALLSLFADQAALALASVERFSLMGRVLLDALARAAQGDVPAGDTPAGDAPAGDDLAGALRQAADHLPAADADLAELAAAFAVLARRGAAERRLALAVLRDIADYTERRPSRR